MRHPSRLPLPALLLAALALPAPAQETASDTLLSVNHYLDWEQVQDPQISPDGPQIIYTRRRVNQIHDKQESALWFMKADGPHPPQLPQASFPRRAPPRLPQTPTRRPAP